MKTLALGTQIVYAREDSGGHIRNENENITLLPHTPLAVGKDVTINLATRLIEDGVCTVFSLPPVEPENVSEDKEVSEDTPHAADDLQAA